MDPILSCQINKFDFIENLDYLTNKIIVQVPGVDFIYCSGLSVLQLIDFKAKPKIRLCKSPFEGIVILTIPHLLAVESF